MLVVIFVLDLIAMLIMSKLGVARDIGTAICVSVMVTACVAAGLDILGEAVGLWTITLNY